MKRILFYFNSNIQLSNLKKILILNSYVIKISRAVLHLNIQLKLKCVNYRASWMSISSLSGQQNLVQEIKQNGTIVHLSSTVIRRVVMPAFQMKILQNCLSFVIHFKLYPSKRVNIHIYRTI